MDQEDATLKAYEQKRARNRCHRAWWARRWDMLRELFGGHCIFCTETEGLWFGHVRPTRLMGEKRGEDNRYQDIVCHVDAYELMCVGCHAVWDRCRGDWAGMKKRKPIPEGEFREATDKINHVLGLIKDANKENGNQGVKMERVLNRAAKAGITQLDAKKYVYQLERSGDVYSPKHGLLKISSNSTVIIEGD